jgi:integrase
LALRGKETGRTGFFELLSAQAGRSAHSACAPQAKEKPKALESAVLQRLSDTVRSGVVPITTKEGLAQWLSEAAAGISPSSHARYRAIVDNALPYLPEMMFDITATQLKRYKSVLVREGKKPRTIIIELNTLDQAFKHAVMMGYMAANPMEHVERPQKPPTTVGRYSDEELDKIFGEIRARATGERPVQCPEAWRVYHDLFMLLFFTGMRVGDAIALTWENVNFPFSVIEFVQQKTGKPTSVRMPTALKERLAAIKEDQVRQEIYDPKGSIFRNSMGNAPTYSPLDRAIRSVLKAVGLNKRSPLHSFRHTVAMRLLDAGVKVHEVAAQLGDTVETIVRVYVKPAIPSQNSVDQAFDEMEHRSGYFGWKPMFDGCSAQRLES